MPIVTPQARRLQDVFASYSNRVLLLLSSTVGLVSGNLEVSLPDRAWYIKTTQVSLAKLCKYFSSVSSADSDEELVRLIRNQVLPFLREVQFFEVDLTEINAEGAMLMSALKQAREALLPSPLRAAAERAPAKRTRGEASQETDDSYAETLGTLKRTVNQYFCSLASLLDAERRKFIRTGEMSRPMLIADAERHGRKIEEIDLAKARFNAIDSIDGINEFISRQLPTLFSGITFYQTESGLILNEHIRDVEQAYEIFYKLFLKPAYDAAVNPPYVRLVENRGLQ